MKTKGVLLEIFEAKRKKRISQKLTLRGFSRFLGINVATLSRVFAGKEELSAKQAKKILDNQYIEDFLKQKIVSIYFPSSTGIGKIKKTNFNQREKQGIFDFTWVDLTLLELFNIEDLDQENEDLAQRLSVSSDQILKSLEKLERHQLIYLHKGHYKKQDRNLFFNSTSEESIRNIRKFHRDLAAKGLEEMDKTLFNRKDRSIDSYVISTHSSKILEAKQKIESFQKELLEFLTEGESDGVYAFNSMIFPLTTSSKI